MDAHQESGPVLLLEAHDRDLAVPCRFLGLIPGPEQGVLGPVFRLDVQALVSRVAGVAIVTAGAAGEDVPPGVELRRAGGLESLPGRFMSHSVLSPGAVRPAARSTAIKSTAISRNPRYS